MKRLFTAILFFLALCTVAQEININKSLEGFDNFMSEVLMDWNEPGAGVAIVYKDKVVFKKGFGYRDYGKKLPVTENTLFQIASNTKLFTTIAAGLLVENGVLKWDSPIKESVPELEFYNDHLNTQVTLRDMLGHRTGITRHDMIWFQSDFTRKELFDRIRFLEPLKPLRQDFIYNNLMYAAVGYAIELRTGKTWEEFVTQEILNPLEMNSTIFSIADMQKSDDFGVPYNEVRDTTLLYKIPLKESAVAVGPAGSMISNLNDMSHWVISLINNGNYNGKEIIPRSVIRESLKPGIAFRNTELEEKGYKERLNSIYCMARSIEIYKGNVLTKHGGDLPGFHSQVAILPQDSIGIVSFVIGDQGAALRDVIMYNVVDRLLGLEQTDWNRRRIADHKERKALSKNARSQTGFDHIEGTIPTHKLEDYSGIFSNEAYGEFIVERKNDSLFFNFRKTVLPLSHYHYNRFDTPNDEDFGKWSLNFKINPQGEIGSAVVSIDQGQVEFIKKPDETLSDYNVLKQYLGKYDFAGSVFEVVIKDDKLNILFTRTNNVLIPYKKNVFKVEKFDDVQVEFILKEDKVIGFKYKTPSGIYDSKKI
ncbi:serine hydrolase [Carboxylicivirga marina]|uniref:serine hydrolase n=1 Tax=Carboxylicivirga marina TaxID=2800988 RepID=UPI00259ADA2D|nr:serine hydrolase [uncultured Carboxylicivirga sp.]